MLADFSPTSGRIGYGKGGTLPEENLAGFPAGFSSPAEEVDDISSTKEEKPVVKKIVLGSESPLKLSAVTQALQTCGIQAQVVPTAAQSGVGEQPFDQETWLGAQNRAQHAAALIPEYDVVVVIESGVFRRQRKYWDIAIVGALLPSGRFLVVESEAIQFPKKAVQEAKRFHGSKTVGQVLEEKGKVKSHKDPHASLVGRSRAEFLRDACIELFDQLKAQKIL
jgi:non-canonical (house-cleaning) NTP pyrophosphatase